jgi:hypothetical protein
MTSPDSTSVRDLSSGQVRSLLAVGLSGQQSGPTSPDGLSAEDILDADPQILAQVIEDLKTPCPDEGPFSIFRVCGADSSQSACFENQSWLQLLASRDTDRETLQCLEETGRVLGRLDASGLTRLTGTLIQLLASDALNDRKDDLFNRVSSAMD